jgi:hypothetical protein
MSAPALYIRAQSNQPLVSLTSANTGITKDEQRLRHAPATTSRNLFQLMRLGGEGAQRDM